MKINLDIELNDAEVDYIMYNFSDKERIELNGYHSCAISLCHIGLITTTDLDEDGKKTQKIFLYKSAIGRLVVNYLKNKDKDE